MKTTRFFILYTYNIYGQHHIASSLVVKEFLHHRRVWLGPGLIKTMGVEHRHHGDDGGQGGVVA